MIILIIFGLILIGCIALDISILIALGIGFVLFFGYGLSQKHSVPEMVQMALKGIKTVKNILMTFLLIGMLTAIWRACGTVATIICYCSWMMKPAIFLPAVFLMNSVMSFLTGTSFGTAATMGVICMTMGNAMQIHPVLLGGSILSGIFFGDRCSPVSTSALLVSELTKTDIFQNIRKMIAYAAVPFVLTCVIYGICGIFTNHDGAMLDVWELFSGSFRLHWAALLPAAVILVLSLFRIKVKATMMISICCAVVVSLLIQQMTVMEVVKTLLMGYHAPASEMGTMLDGGGVVSMLRVSAIIIISSSYSGMFEGTHMLDRIKERISSLGDHVPAFAGIFGISVATAAVSCNQTLAIILTRQLCDQLEKDPQKMAIDLEDAPVVIAPLIPWSIAGSVPVTTIGAPTLCLAAACYLYLIPLWHLITDLYTFKKQKASV